MNEREEELEQRATAACDPAQAVAIPTLAERREISDEDERDIITFEIGTHLARGVLDAFEIETTPEAIQAIGGAMFYKLRAALWNPENLEATTNRSLAETERCQITLYHAAYYGYDASKPLQEVMPPVLGEQRTEAEYNAWAEDFYGRIGEAIYERLHPIFWEEPAPPIPEEARKQA